MHCRKSWLTVHCRKSWLTVSERLRCVKLSDGQGGTRRAPAPAALLGRSSTTNKMLGGEGGIRTPDTVTRMPHFECGAFNHSATSPWPHEAQTFCRSAAMYPTRDGLTRTVCRPARVIVAFDRGDMT